MPERSRHPSLILRQIKTRIAYPKNRYRVLRERLKVITSEVSREEYPSIFLRHQKPGITNSPKRWISFIYPPDQTAAELVIGHPGKSSDYLAITHDTTNPRTH